MTSWSPSDVLAIVDVSADETQQISVQNLLKVPWTYLQGTPSQVISVGDGIVWNSGGNILNSTDKLDDVLRRGSVSATRGATFGNTVIVNNGNLIVPSGVGKLLVGTSVHSGGSAIAEMSGDLSFAQGFGVTYRNSIDVRKYKTFYDSGRNEYAVTNEDLTDNTGSTLNINTKYSQNSDLLSVNRNSILRVSRGNPSDYESVELRNVGQPSTMSFQHSLRVSKTGIGVLRDFVFEYFDGTTTEIFRTNGSSKITDWKQKVLFSNAIQYTNGSQGLDKVLVSDANGNATWDDIANILPPSSADKYVSDMVFDTNTNILTLTRAGGLVNLTQDLSSLADAAQATPTLQQVVTQGRTSTLPIYSSSAFYGGTANTGITLTSPYKFVAYGGNSSVYMKFMNDPSGLTASSGLNVGLNSTADGIIEVFGSNTLTIRANGQDSVIFGVSNGDLFRVPDTTALGTTAFSTLAIFSSNGTIGSRTINQLGLATEQWVISVLPSDYVSRSTGGRFQDEVEAVTAFKTVTQTGIPVVINEYISGNTGRIRIRTTSLNDVVYLNGESNQFITGGITLGSNQILDSSSVYIDAPLTVGVQTTNFFGIVKMLATNNGTAVNKGLGIGIDGTVVQYDLSGVGGDNNYVTSGSFSAANGNLTLNRSGLSSVTINLDGRYLTSYTVTQGDVSNHMDAFDGKNILWNGSQLQVDIKSTNAIGLLGRDSNGDITSGISLSSNFSITGGVLNVTSVTGTANKIIGETSGGTIVDMGLGTGFTINSGTLNYKVVGTSNFIPRFDSTGAYGIVDSLLFQSGTETRSNGAFRINGSLSVKTRIDLTNIFFFTSMGDYGASGTQKCQLYYNGGDDTFTIDLEQGCGFKINDNSALSKFEIDDNDFVYFRDLPTSSGGNSSRLWRDGSGILHVG